MLAFIQDHAATIQAIAEIFGALAVVVVAVIAQDFTRRSAKMQFIFESAKLVSDWNRTVLSDPSYIDAVQSIRKSPSESFVRDYLMFNLLTYVETLWRLKQENVYRGPLVESEIENVLTFFDGNRAYLVELLSRGYGSDFAADILEAFDRAARASAGRQPSQ